MPLEASPEEFAELFRATVGNRNADVTQLMNISRPFITYWADNLKARFPDVQIVSLLKLLDPDLDVAISKVEQWIASVEETHSLEDELNEVFLETIRSLSYCPPRAKPRKVEYIVALQFKRKLKDLIDYHHPVIKTVEAPLTTAPREIDWYLLKKLTADTWDESLIFWICRGYDAEDISATTYISKETIRNDVRKLCQISSTDRTLSPVRAGKTD